LQLDLVDLLGVNNPEQIVQPRVSFGILKRKLLRQQLIR